ncbi:MAG: hypothetical protein ACI8X5_000498 [Planctomycetota bacterium]|jgi:hypothetical protein
MQKFLVLLMVCVGCIVLWFRSSAPGEARHLERAQAENGEPENSLAIPAMRVDVTRSPIPERVRVGLGAQGRVVDAETNLPISSASVEVLAGEGVVCTWTSASGHYYLEGIQQEQTLRFRAQGYADADLQLMQLELLGVLEDIRLVPSHLVEVLVTSDNGAPVTDALVKVLPTKRPYEVSERSRGGVRGAAIQTNAHGVARVRIPETCHIAASDSSGRFGSAVAVPGKRCEIVLEATGAEFSFRAENPGKGLGSLQFALRRLGGALDYADVALSGAPELLVLPAGRWKLDLGDESPFVVASVVRDGVQLFEASDFAVQFTVLKSTTEVEIILRGGLDFRLVDGASGLPVVGPFTYRRRIQLDNGSWSDRIPHAGMTDSNGRVVLAPIFSEDLNGGGVSLRIDVPGYSPGELNWREVLEARQVSDSRELRLTKSDATSFILEYLDGTPFTGPVMLEAVRLDSKRELFVGMVASGVNIPPVNLGIGEAVCVSHWSRQEIVSRPAGAIDLGRTNTLVVERPYGRLQVLGVPPDIPHIAVVGARGDEHVLTRKGSQLISAGLFPGVYYLGPLEMARRSSERSLGFGSSSLQFGGRVVHVVIEAGEESSVDWLEAWKGTSDIEGVIHVQGAKDSIVLIPIYSQGGQSTTFGSSMRKVYLDDTGRYRLPQSIVLPDSLAVCSLDEYGVPVPIDVVEPGADASVSVCSVRLIWVGGSGAGYGLVKYAIDPSAFREPLDLVSNEYQVGWDLESPLLLRGIPCGNTLLSIKVGSKWLTKDVSLDSREPGYLDVQVP